VLHHFSILNQLNLGSQRGAKEKMQSSEIIYTCGQMDGWMGRWRDIPRLIVAFHNCFENVHNKTKIKYSNTVLTLAESILSVSSPI
jgi:hypothetical protein